jgi:lipoate-protein ligase A
MQSVDLTLPTVAENVALDEALLELAESGPGHDEYFRLWESPEPCVVVGRSSQIDREVNAAECRSRSIPIVRRSSGGAAIVAGPGCLMYAVVLSHRERPELRDITHAHRFVMARIAGAVRPLAAAALETKVAGTSDLVLHDRTNVEPPRKFSGNSLHVKRTHFLYHGTILYNFNLSLIAQCLLSPPRQPEYRSGRDHRAFVTNLTASRAQLVDAMTAAWPTTNALAAVPWGQVKELVAARFGQDSWTFERR